MKKKLYITILTLLAILAFSISYTFAANNMTAVDGIRNVVGGAENVVEDAGRGIVDGVRNVTSAGQNTMENVTGNTKNGTQNTGNRTTGTMTNGNNNYTATRTTTTRAATGTNDGTFLGMNSTVWTWLIMAIVGIAIVALVWMYAKQNHHSYND